MKETGPELAENIEEKIAKFGYEPEDSFGFCPNFDHNLLRLAQALRLAARG